MREAQEVLLPPSMRAAARLLNSGGHSRPPALPDAESAMAKPYAPASQDSAATIVVAKFRWVCPDSAQIHVCNALGMCTHFVFRQPSALPAKQLVSCLSMLLSPATGLCTGQSGCQKAHG